MVRYQTLTLLSNLIKEQFLKWEGQVVFFKFVYLTILQIMYRFVSTLLDPEMDVREYAEFCLVIFFNLRDNY